MDAVCRREAVDQRQQVGGLASRYAILSPILIQARPSDGRIQTAWIGYHEFTVGAFVGQK